MKITKEDLQCSINYLAKKLNITCLINSSENGAIRLDTRRIIHFMFLTEFDYNSCSPTMYKHYKNVHNYSTELFKKGYVNFKK